MNIFVLMKQVPVISDIKINHQTFTVDRSTAGSMMNPSDAHAITAAVSLKKVSAERLLFYPWEMKVVKLSFVKQPAWALTVWSALPTMPLPAPILL